MARKIDPTKSAEENLYTLISSNNSGLEVNSSKVTLGTPTPLSTPIGSRDTELPLTAVDNKGFSGTSKVRYNRLQLDQNIANAPKSFNLLNGSETFDSLKARICKAWSIIPTEVVFNNGQLWTLPTDQGSSKTLSIQPKAGSLVYNGDLINLTIALPVPAAGYADFVKFLSDTYGPVTTGGGITFASRLYAGAYTVNNLDGGFNSSSAGVYTSSTIEMLMTHAVVPAAIRQDYLANKRAFGFDAGAVVRPGGFDQMPIPTLYYWDEANQRAVKVKAPLSSTPVTTNPALVSGEVVFTTPGTYQWVVPDGVYSVSAVAIGGGAGSESYGGSGGGLGWRNDIAVTPGQVITIQVGQGGSSQTSRVNNSGNFYRVGQDSYFKDAVTVIGRGATGGAPGGSATPGNFVGDGGGLGGVGSVSGGGGAGGYTGNGGNGGNSGGSVGNPGTGGAAGGGGTDGSYRGGAGGGTGLEGQTDGGAAGDAGKGGKGGSGGSNGADSSGTNAFTGGGYGGGAGGANTGAITNGGSGAVRVIWGIGRAFPKTKTVQYFSGKNITLNGPYTPIDVKGETVFTKVGRNSFVVPDGVTSLSAVTVSGGAAMAKGAGAGGTTAWKNSIPVTPGETLFVDVGPGQSQSSTTSLRTAIYRGTTLLMVAEGPNGANPGSFTADGGGLGGAGVVFNDGSGGGGGGAGGYTDKGGDWGSSFTTDGLPGKGGGGGAGTICTTDFSAGLAAGQAGGGGVGLFGQGENGAGGNANTTNSGGKGGSGGDNAQPITSTSTRAGTSGAKFGGGAGGPGKNTVNPTSVVGGQGGARLVWGKGRAFPGTNVSQAFSDTIKNVA